MSRLCTIHLETIRDGEEVMQIQLVLHPISSTRVRPEASNWIDLFWKGKGWFHVFRDGEKIDVTCDNNSMSQKPGDFMVFREVNEVDNET